MKFIKSPETFRVEEVLQPQLGDGKYYYYVLEKSGISTHNAVKLLERQNDTRIYVSGLKDAAATALQWICAEKKLVNSDKRMELLFMGNSSKRIYVGMHNSNKFSVVLADISDDEGKFLEKELRKMQLPNYFDEQRFSPRTLEVAEFMLQEKWKEAVKAALTESSEFESEKSKMIKKMMAGKGGKWKELSENKELPIPKRMIFELLDTEEDFRKAFELLPRKAVGIYCRACQGLKFNEMLAMEIDKQKQKRQKYVLVAGRKLPVVFKYKALKRGLEIAGIFPSRTVLKRKTFFVPKNLKIEPMEKSHEGKESAGKSAKLMFELRKGCYATLLVKCAMALSGSAGK